MSNISTSKIARSGLWLITSFGATKLIQLIAQILLVRLLTPEEFGIWGMVLVIIYLAELFKDDAIAGVLVQRGIENSTLVNGVYSIGINVTILIVITQIIAGYVASIFFHEPLVFPLSFCASVGLLINAGSGSHAAVLQRRMKFRELSFTEACTSFTRFGGAVLLAWAGLGVWAFAIARAASSLVNAFLKYWFSRYQFQYYLWPEPAVFQEVGGFIVSIIGINLAVYANTNGDDIVVGRVLGARELGFYSLAYQLAMLPAFAMSQINRVNFSVISQKEQAEQYQYVYRVLELCAITSAPVYAIAFVVAPWVIPLVYGQAWQPVVPLFQIILVFAYARGFMAILGTALNALNYPQVNAAINWILTPISISAFIIGARVGSTQGIATAVACVMGVGATLWFWVATCRVAQWNVFRLAQPVIVPTVASLLMAVFSNHLPIANNFLRYALQPIIIGIGYLCLIGIASKGKSFGLFINLSKKFLEK